MKTRRRAFPLAGSRLLQALRVAAVELDPNPADHLTPHLAPPTPQGERANGLHDETRIPFRSKTSGDARAIGLAAKALCKFTAHFSHDGCLPARDLAGDNEVTELDAT